MNVNSCIAAVQHLPKRRMISDGRRRTDVEIVLDVRRSPSSFKLGKCCYRALE